MMKLDLVALPSFMLVALSILWVPLLASLTGLLKWWRLRGARNDMFAM